MISFLTKLYEWMQEHRNVRMLSCVFLSALFVLLILNQNYKEDISDFLPLSEKYQKALAVYQDMSGADRILAIFQCEDSTVSDPDLLVRAIEDYTERYEIQVPSDQKREIVAQVDLEKYSTVVDFAYKNIPYFLTDDDYEHIDSLLSDDIYVQSQIANVKQMLMFPASGLLAENFQRDPLNIFTPVISQLQPSNASLNYELYDGYIFSPDMKFAIVTITSPHGASETEKNAEFLSVLESIAIETEAECGNVEIRHIGGPVIAVGNSTQIKNDSILSVALAVVLIAVLLLVVFRNIRNIFLIVLSIAWGWLFAMGLLALLHDSVSVIVIGISSVILGIAVNYPLHLIAHMEHTSNMKSALKEIATPLVVGNITTVGAFLALVPLKSVALRDLGLFSSFLLIGTILFVLVYLPHFVKKRSHTSSIKGNIFTRLANVSFENNRWIVWGIIILTVVFGYFSFDTSFDANMNHINYMTNTQKNDFAMLQKMLNQETDKKVYVVSSDTTIDGALKQSESLRTRIRKMEEEGIVKFNDNSYRFLPSTEVQQQRLERWNKFVEEYADKIQQSVTLYAKEEGFVLATFDNFFDILRDSYSLLTPEELSVLYEAPLAHCLIVDNGEYHIINTLATDEQHIAQVENEFDNVSDTQYAFDVKSMNSSIATSISDDFNYIGIACGLIVFLFLWFSLGSIELAILSFLPMSLSWVWILGIMSMLNIQFNVVNVILATFIFGQGDDYTIFMTEGCQYEYAYRKKMLASYKNSIIVSALIMFIGIGTLIVARHPALHSLAEVTIVGMFSVVLMAYVFPPLIYKWIVSDGGSYRTRPFTLSSLFVMLYCSIILLAQLAMGCILGFFMFVLMKPATFRKEFFYRYARKCFWLNIRIIPKVKFSLRNPHNEDFTQPSIMVCNHQSIFDMVCITSLTHKIAIVSNENTTHNKLMLLIFRWLDNYLINVNNSLDEERIRALIEEGYSIVIFPEGERNPLSSISQFHKDAFYLAERNGVDIVPLILHGANHVFPHNAFSAYPGEITLAIGARIKANDASWGNTYVERAQSVHRYYINEYSQIRQEKENAVYYQHFVLDRYRYKGLDIYSAVKRRLRQHSGYAKWVDNPAQNAFGDIAVVNGRHGEFPLMYALVHPEQTVHMLEDDEDMYCIAKYSAQDVAKNMIVHIGQYEDLISNIPAGFQLFLIEPTIEQEMKYQKYNPIIIK